IEDKGACSSLIGISVDAAHRGKGYASEMLRMATGDYLSRFPASVIYAHVFLTNKASYKSFIKAGFQLFKEEELNGIPSFILNLSQAKYASRH
ncbi:GNAT family N-acetyltransferase, partial [Flavitalea antarctica]